MDLRMEFIEYIESIDVSPDELPGELADIAMVIDEHAPGLGAQIAFIWAKSFRGVKVYWRDLRLNNDAMRYAKSNEKIDESDLVPASIEDLRSETVKVLARKADEVASGKGLNIILRIAWTYRGSVTYIHNVDGVIAARRNEWILEKYSRGGIPSWRLAAATELSERRIQEILGGKISKARPNGDRAQMNIFEYTSPLPCS